ncbi:flavin reductase family protein [Demequina capsici]|uniref:Flavin reductase family protein n=1 Tax=Demequina capsici TaxID=3075620 RepID=A0AA96FBP1_9MICO|nr:flavin reductase family protein [Demequina sp. PMTSA13]WNM26902.1 flavin reductase family protein [Demequina sp. PMTSA13]
MEEAHCSDRGQQAGVQPLLGPDGMPSPGVLASAWLGDPTPDTLKAAFGAFPSGVAALCAEVDGMRRGLAATSFTVGVSFDPPLVVCSVQNTSTTWPHLRTATRIGVSVLGAGHESVCLELAKRAEDKFANLSSVSSGSGAVFIAGAPVWLECSVVTETPVGDHTLVVLKVDALSVLPEQDPLVYHAKQFRRLAG